MQEHEKLIRRRLDEASCEKLAALDNPRVGRFVAEFVELCDPASVFVSTDGEEDRAYVRRRAAENGEEMPLAMEGHTVHFDGYHDQGRDPANTKYLLPPGADLGQRVRSIDREQGLAEVLGYLRGSMQGKEMLVRFYTLGPVGSAFAIPAVQITDSAYVAHSEDILYRPGYEQLRRADPQAAFFRFVHTAGRLEDRVSADVEKRCVYIDLEESIIYSTNTQYAGNTVGLKKLALRLAIRKASREAWLAEHMLIVGIRGPGGRRTYFTGAFPSGCGKTSTAMLPGESIVGDDIAYLRKVDGQARAANVESGIFGIIRDVNPDDDPLIWQALIRPGEVIFSNVLVTEDGVPRWHGDGRPPPERGINHSGQWWPGKEDEASNPIDLSHWNARYTIHLECLDNYDPLHNDPDGVPVHGVIYGGRDSDTWVPVEQAFDWTHGIITKGASLESESTAATIGVSGVRRCDPMSNLDFISIPIGRYIRNNLDFAADLSDVPLIFGVNYFLKGPRGEYLNEQRDKRAWLKWMELRVHEEVDAIETPTGLIPLYRDMRHIFQEHLGKEYEADDYVEQFQLRIPEQLAKVRRIEKVYREQVPDAPEVLYEVLQAQRERLEAARARHGDYVSPFDF
ncbi:MAG: phosphoenolpyruvate carboxykinase [Planctomycetes bacterium SM23_32]|nr:MAG: phosphoenolpyruvate carboxykinase [Planctomycetes bacterium SM23_32]